MTVPVLGTLAAEPVSARPDLVAAPVRMPIEAHGLGDRIGVLAIDPALSETAATQETYGLDPARLVNPRRSAATPPS